MAATDFALRSSWLTGGRYDPDTQFLTVSTRDGREYTHSGVPPDVVAALANAESPGSFYHAAIKGRY